MELKEFRELYVQFIGREHLLENPALLERELSEDVEWELILDHFHEEEKRRQDQGLSREDAELLLRSYKGGYNSGCRSGVDGKNHPLYD